MSTRSMEASCERRWCHDLKSSPIFELSVRASHPFSYKFCRERSPSRMFNLDTALRSGCVPATSGYDPATSGYDPATITAQRPSQRIMNCYDWPVLPSGDGSAWTPFCLEDTG